MARIFIITLVTLSVLLAGSVAIKYFKKERKITTTVQKEPIPIQLDEQITVVQEVTPPLPPPPSQPKPAATPRVEPAAAVPITAEGLPSKNRMDELFKAGSLFPLVQTVTYKSKVAWLKGRPAWISDYASHYKTSRHFIARSLHGKGNYYKEEIANGNKFTVLNPDRDIEFHLLVDLSRARLWLYAYDRGAHKRYLLKDYAVGLGRPDTLKSSGLTTPRGKYLLGNRIVAYKPGMMGVHNGKKTEMIRVFGTRWIPFEKEIANTSAPAKGFGIHGAPWVDDGTSGKLKEDASSIGCYASDGCVRLAADDMEEIYAIIVTRPAYIDLVNRYEEAKLLGEEAP